MLFLLDCYNLTLCYPNVANASFILTAYHAKLQKLQIICLHIYLKKITVLFLVFKTFCNTLYSYGQTQIRLAVVTDGTNNYNYCLQALRCSGNYYFVNDKFRFNRFGFFKIEIKSLEKFAIYLGYQICFKNPVASDAANCETR